MRVTNETRRSIMLMAWSFKRSEPARRFGACLKGAWSLMKGMARTAQAIARKTAGGRPLQLSPSLIRSPIQRVTRGQRYGAYRDFQAAHLTVRLGA